MLRGRRHMPSRSNTLTEGAGHFRPFKRHPPTRLHLHPRLPHRSGQSADGRMSGSSAVVRKSVKSVDWNSSVIALRNVSTRLVAKRTANLGSSPVVVVDVPKSSLAVGRRAIAPLEPELLVVSSSELVVASSELELSTLCCVLDDLLVPASVVPLAEVPVSRLSRLLRLPDVSLVLVVPVVSLVVPLVVLLPDRTPGVCPFWVAFTRPTMKARCRAIAAWTQLPGVPPLALNAATVAYPSFGSVVVWT